HLDPPLASSLTPTGSDVAIRACKLLMSHQTIAEATQRVQETTRRLRRIEHAARRLLEEDKSSRAKPTSSPGPPVHAGSEVSRSFCQSPKNHRSRWQLETPSSSLTSLQETLS